MRISLLVLVVFTVWGADIPAGQKIYNAACAVCHDNFAGMRVPSRAVLNGMRAADILRALETGAMREAGEKLQPDERKAVAAFLGKRDGAAAVPATGACVSSGA